LHLAAERFRVCEERRRLMMKRRMFLVLGLAGTLLVGSFVGLVVAGTVIKRTGRAVTQVKVLSDASSQQVGDTTWQDLPGAATSVTVPSNSSAVVLARFTSATTCLGEKGKSCLVRILIDGQEADPALGDRSYIDSAPNLSSPTNDADSPESHSVERSLGPLPGGTYRMKVQYKNAIGTGTVFDGWNLTVERVKA
jgi:hypothetical protein